MALIRFKSNWKIRLHFDWLEKYLENQSYPICVEIDPSNSCPLNCPYCCWSKIRDHKQPMISKKKLLEVIKELSELGTKSIIWTGGGEPLTNPFTTQAIAYARKLGLDNGMFTNAVLLNKPIADSLANNLNWIRFHVGGSTAKTYAMNHGVGENIFNTVCENIKYFAAKNDISCGIGTPINKINFESVKKLPELALKLGVEYFQAKLDFSEVSKKDYKDWWFSTVVPYFKKAEERLKDKLKIHVFSDPIITKTNCLYCHAHHVITAINAMGDVAFCKMRRDQKKNSLGNIYEKSLKEIFDGKKHKKIAANISPKTCPILTSFCPYRTSNEVIDELVKLKSGHGAEHLNFF